MIRIYPKAGPGKPFNGSRVKVPAFGMSTSISNIYLKSSRYFFLTFIESFYSPGGKKFRSRNEIRDYIKKNKLPLNYRDFDFSLRGKEKPGIIPPNMDQVIPDGIDY